MIYLSAMASIIPFLVSFVLVLAPQSAGKPGPWKSLFDGKSLDAWRIFKTDKAPKMCETPGAKDCWEIKDGVLQKEGKRFEFSLLNFPGAPKDMAVVYQDALRMITEGTPGITGFLLQLGPFGGAYVHGWAIRVWAVVYLAVVLALGLFAFSRRNL